MKCDYCKKKAICNYQDAIIRWDVLKDGSYDNSTIQDEGTGDNLNIHLCIDHEEKYLNGKLDL